VFFLIFLSFWNGQGKTKILNKMVARIPEIQFLISLWIQFRFVTVFPKYMNIVTFPHDFLASKPFWIGNAKFSENIIHYFSCDWVTYLPDIYKQLMYCPIILPFLGQHLTNAEHLIRHWSFMSKSTLMIPNNFVYMWSLHWDKNIDKIDRIGTFVDLRTNFIITSWLIGSAGIWSEWDDLNLFISK